MTPIASVAAATAEAPSRLDPLQLFLDADIVVQVVIVGRRAAISAQRRQRAKDAETD